MKQEVQLLADHVSRRRKAQKILTVLAQQAQADLSTLNCVDLGCAFGLISQHLSERFRYTLGIEYDINSLNKARPLSHSRLAFVQADACRLPISTESIDVVVCAQVYEHVADAEALVSEIYRILKPGGACYFSGPNRLDIIERHYGLLFVSWLPRGMADAYIRLVGKGTKYSEHPRSFWALKRLWCNFNRIDFTWRMIKTPEDYASVDELGGLVGLKYIPEWLLRLFSPFYPNYNWMLIKPLGKSSLHVSPFFQKDSL